MAPKYNKVSSGRKCQLTGQKANNAMVVTFSHKRNKKLQHVNLQKKKVFWPEVRQSPLPNLHVPQHDNHIAYAMECMLC